MQPLHYEYKREFHPMRKIVLIGVLFLSCIMLISESRANVISFEVIVDVESVVNTSNWSSNLPNVLREGDELKVTYRLNPMKGRELRYGSDSSFVLGMVEQIVLEVNELRFESSVTGCLVEILNNKTEQDGIIDAYELICTHYDDINISYQNKKFWQLYWTIRSHDLSMRKTSLDISVPSIPQHSYTTNLFSLALADEDKPSSAIPTTLILGSIVSTRELAAAN